MVYLPTTLLQPTLQTYNTKFISDSMFMNLYFTRLIQPSRNYSKTLLREQIQVEFMGNAYYFLGTVFNYLQQDDGNISVHLCQSKFTEFTAH